MQSWQQTHMDARAARLEWLRIPGVRIGPSVLSADFYRLGEQIEQVRSAGAELLHLDVMDGHFVPNISIGVPVVASIRQRTDMFLDVHVMISDPQYFAEPFAKAGADLITFHIEATTEPMRIIERLRSLQVGVGVAFNPGTPVEAISPVLEAVDLVLAMTVWPGFGGQEFIEPVLEKVRSVRDKLRPDQRLEVDGGIGAGTISAAAEAGADTFVAGSAIFDSADPATEVSRLTELAKASYRGQT